MPTVEPSSTAHTNNSPAKITQQLVVLKKLQASTALEEILAHIRTAKRIWYQIKTLDPAKFSCRDFYTVDDALFNALKAADQSSKLDSKKDEPSSDQKEAKRLKDEIRVELTAFGKFKVKKVKELIDYYKKLIGDYVKQLPKVNLATLESLHGRVKNLYDYVQAQNGLTEKDISVKTKLAFVLRTCVLKLADLIIAKKILQELHPNDGELPQQTSLRLAAQKYKTELIHDEILREKIMEVIDDKISKLPSPIAKPNSAGAAATTATVAPSTKAANRPRAATDTSAQRRTPSDVTASWRTKHVQRFVALNYGSPLHVPMNPVREKELKDVSKQDNKFMLPVLHLS